MADRDPLNQLVDDLADRVYQWSRDQEQAADVLVLARARDFGWRPWHERKAQQPIIARDAWVPPVQTVADVRAQRQPDGLPFLLRNSTHRPCEVCGDVLPYFIVKPDHFPGPEHRHVYIAFTTVLRVGAARLDQTSLPPDALIVVV